MASFLSRFIMSPRSGIWLGLLALFLFYSPYHPKLNNPNEGVRIYMVKSIVDHGEYHIDSVVKKWGYVDDKSKREGKLYSSKAPIMSMMGAGAYKVYRVFGDPLNQEELTRFCRRFAGAVPAFLLLVLLAFLYQKIVTDRRNTDLIAISLAAGTHVLAYVHVFSGHTLAALASGILLLVLLLKDDRAQVAQYGAVAGAAASIAVTAEYPAFLAVAPLSLGYLIKHFRSIHLATLGMVAGALPCTLVAAIAQHKMFGMFWKTGYSFLENRNYNQLHSQGFFGISGPKSDVLFNVIFSPEVGMIFFAPFTLLGIWGLIWLSLRATDNRERMCFLWTTIALVLLFLFIGGHRGWRGGWVVGPRYISEATCLLVVLAGLYLHRIDAFSQKKHLVLFAVALTTLGIIHSGIAGAFFPHLSTVFRNPVYEMMVPMSLAGFSPNSLFLELGLSAQLSSWCGLFLLFLPLLIWIHVYGDGDLYPRLGVYLGTMCIAFTLGRALPGSHPDTVSVETRHTYRMWHPAEGRPISEPLMRTDNLSAQFAMEPGRHVFKKLDEMCRSPRGEQ
jgi:hypothetical protein